MEEKGIVKDEIIEFSYRFVIYKRVCFSENTILLLGDWVELGCVDVFVGRVDDDLRFKLNFRIRFYK